MLILEHYTENINEQVSLMQQFEEQFVHMYSRVSQLGCHLNSLKTPNSEGTPSVGCINLLIHPLVALSNH